MNTWMWVWLQSGLLVKIMLAYIHDYNGAHMIPFILVSNNIIRMSYDHNDVYTITVRSPFKNLALILMCVMVWAWSTLGLIVRNLISIFSFLYYLFQYFTFCVMLVMIMCAVYQILISLAKLVILSCICASYLLLVMLHVGWVAVLSCMLPVLSGLQVSHQ